MVDNKVALFFAMDETYTNAALPFVGRDAPTAFKREERANVSEDRSSHIAEDDKQSAYDSEATRQSGSLPTRPPPTYRSRASRRSTKSGRTSLSSSEATHSLDGTAVPPSYKTKDSGARESRRY